VEAMAEFCGSVTAERILQTFMISIIRNQQQLNVINHVFFMESFQN